MEDEPLEPDPVIEAYKMDIDRTLLRENLKLTVKERFRSAMAPPVLPMSCGVLAGPRGCARSDRIRD